MQAAFPHELLPLYSAPRMRREPGPGADENWNSHVSSGKYFT